MVRVLFALAMLFAAAPARAELSEVRITKQPGIIYLAPIVMEQQKLFEKAAEGLGLKGVTARYMTFGGGGAATDALLSGNVEIVTTGASNMLLLWDRTRGQVKGLAGSSATPMWLVTSNPAVKTLADFSMADRIAVPTVKISSQAIILQIAARKLFGDAAYDRFDAMTVTLAHPDAAVAVMNGGGSVNGHFSGAPFQAMEADAPGVRVVATSDEILGGAYSNAVYFTNTKFYDGNPTLVRAFMQAAREASDWIAANPREACEMYLRVSGDKGSVDTMLKQIGDPKTSFSVAPFGMMQVARHMALTKVSADDAGEVDGFLLSGGGGVAGELGVCFVGLVESLTLTLSRRERGLAGALVG